MMTYISRTATFSHDEIGTLAVRKIQRCNELGEKRKRKAALREVAVLLPFLELSINTDATIELLGVSIGVDVNGEQLVFASYRVMALMEKESADTK